MLATDAIALDTDTRGVDVQWSENATADSFGKNLVLLGVNLVTPQASIVR